MGSTLQDLIMNPRGMGNVNNMGDQGLSPPYSNQSPPHSVQSNIALSPQGYIGKEKAFFSHMWTKKNHVF